jgi:hypothetical protein
MSVSRLALMGAAGAGGGIAVEDAFSTDLYTGNSSTQTITNGIDLAGEGGLVWTKSRDTSNYWHELTDTERGATYNLFSNAVNAEGSGSDVATFNSDGFDLRFSTAYGNQAGKSYAAWTFRKAPKFFDVVTYTGDGVAGREIPHNLGVTPGMVVVKRRDASENWATWHRTLPGEKQRLNTTIASGATFSFGAHTETTFIVGYDGEVNASGGTYVAYLFAHNDAADGIIQCGGYTGNGNSAPIDINLGWPAQWVLIKRSNSTSDWILVDTARGLGNRLEPNTTDAELGGNVLTANPDGFTVVQLSVVNAPSAEYIYMAIRAEGT